MSQYDIDATRCPYCGHVNELGEDMRENDMGDGDDSVTTCRSCDKEFRYTVVIHVMSSTSVSVGEFDIDWSNVHPEVNALYYNCGEWIVGSDHPTIKREVHGGWSVCVRAFWPVAFLTGVSKNSKLYGTKDFKTLITLASEQQAKNWVANNIHVRPLK